MKLNGVDVVIITDKQMSRKDSSGPGYKMGRSKFFIRKSYLEERRGSFLPGDSDRAVVADIYREFQHSQKEAETKKASKLSYFDVLIQSKIPESIANY